MQRGSSRQVQWRGVADNETLYATIVIQVLAFVKPAGDEAGVDTGSLRLVIGPRASSEEAHDAYEPVQYDETWHQQDSRNDEGQGEELGGYGQAIEEHLGTWPGNLDCVAFHSDPGPPYQGA
jgi:hypothetical protein